MSGFADVGLTVGGLVIVIGIVASAMKAWNVIDARIEAHVKEETTRASEQMTVAIAKAGAVEIKADRAMDDLAAFKLEAARTYVTHDVQRRLEDRIDAGFRSVRDEMETLRGALLDALTERPTPRRRARADVH